MSDLGQAAGDVIRAWDQWRAYCRDIGVEVGYGIAPLEQAIERLEGTLASTPELREDALYAMPGSAQYYRYVTPWMTRRVPDRKPAA